MQLSSDQTPVFRMPNGEAPDGTISAEAADHLPADGAKLPENFQIVEQFSSAVSVAAEDEEKQPSSGSSQPNKEPKQVARNYQLELCKKALEENVIVYLGTGCGKTHIAVLLIYELGHLIKKPQNKICVFLAPSVALVQQQAKVIEESIDFKVGVYCGGAKHLNNPNAWEKEIQQYEILVMTPQILFRNLSHCFIRMDFIELLIFDECHHAQVTSNHPYAEIMKVFYRTSANKLPRIFGMTASPIVGKGASDQENLQKEINSLEKLLDAKVYTVENHKELDTYVASPVLRVYYYGPVVGSTASSSKLEEMKHQCISTTSKKIVDHQSLRNERRLLNKIHDNLLFCLESLGLIGTLQASQLYLGGDCSMQNDLVGEERNGSDGNSLCDRYLAHVAEFFSSDLMGDGHASDISHTDLLKEPFFSKKLLCLIGILSNFRLQPNMKCIIFVDRIVTARSLSYILQKIKCLASWKCDFLVGVHSGLKRMSRKNTNLILEKFRSGKLNLLVATKVGEEGLDIQTCCLVIRFDLPETVASFIQSRGRARMPQSEYAFLVDRGNQKHLELIENLTKEEKIMNLEVSFRTSNESFVSNEARVLRINASGASITAGYSISLLHQYCSKLPHDEYFDPKPKFFYIDEPGGVLCQIILPSNAPVHQIRSSPQSSKEAAKKDACLIAIEELHKQGVLNDYLLPVKDDADVEELSLVLSDPNSSEDKGSRRELYEMLVPAALKEPWSHLENHIHLNSYYLKFSPNPADRIYKSFGLFIKASLPVEAAEMELDLHLAHGRSVMTKFVPSGVVEFAKDEIIQAQNFQEIFLKLILDRSEFIPEFVPLGMTDLCKSSSLTFYLLLPVIFHDYERRVTVDWKIVRRCLSSPLFSTPADVNKGIPPKDVHLQLANGCRNISDVENSVVYVPYKKKNNFFFVTNIVREKNAYSPHKDSSCPSFVEHMMKKYNTPLKYPKQYLLHAKPLFGFHNLLCNRKQKDSDPRELEEYFIDLPPELCQLKIIGFSKDIGSSVSLLPSIMHRLENLLVAIELRGILSASFPEGAEVTAQRVLEALTTEKCLERFSLERLEILGDAFLKFAVGRALFVLYDTLDEGGLTRKRSNLVNNSNLYKLATRSNLQVYIRDQLFDPNQFYALGHPCLKICNEETEEGFHSQYESTDANSVDAGEIKCSKCHHWLYKKTIADVVEALVGAFVVDSGFKGATAFLRWIGIHVDFEASQVHNIFLSSSRYMPLAAYVDIGTLENIVGHQFTNKGLLLQAFVHPSYNKLGGGCYQRLEFLGDAVLDYLITSYLYSVYPRLKPGQLTDLRSAAVNNNAFACIAVDRSFHKYIVCDSDSLSEAITTYVDFLKTPASERDLLEGPKCPKALGDLVESCLGAILLDTGFDLHFVWEIMLSLLDPSTSFSHLQFDPFRELQEFCQARKLVVECLESKYGGIYLVELKVNGNGFCETASGSNKNKKYATRIAAKKIAAKLKAGGYMPKSNSLEKVLKSSCKMEAKLIGYDESPIYVKALNANRNFPLNPKGNFLKDTDAFTTGIKPTCRQPRSPYETIADEGSGIIEDQNCTQPKGAPFRGLSKMRLYEICAANCWKSPSFECKEEGPGHFKLFTCKVIVEIEEASSLILECLGGPQLKKKAATEEAAEGAIWYLNCKGYLSF